MRTRRGPHYDVYLLGASRTARVETGRLQQIFHLTAGEAEVCGRALQGKTRPALGLRKCE